MRKFFSIFFLLFAFTHVFSQYKVRFVVRDFSITPQDSIYIAGTFNNWDPSAGEQNKLTPDGRQTHSITLNLPAGKTFYKYTRGSWLSVEQTNIGFDIDNRFVTIQSDTTVKDTIRSWRDLVLDEMIKALPNANTDSAKLSLLLGIMNNYAFETTRLNPDSSLFYSKQAILLLDKSKTGMDNASWMKSKYAEWLMNIRESTAALLHSRGNYPKALELRLDNLSLAEERGNLLSQVRATGNIITDYLSMRDYVHVLTYGKLLDSLHRAFHHDQKNPVDGISEDANAWLSLAYSEMGNLDSALYYSQKIHGDIGSLIGDYRELRKLNQLGDIYRKKGEDQLALHYYRQVIQNTITLHYPTFVSMSQQGMAKIFQKQGRLDSALIYARRSLATIQNEAVYVQAAGENLNDRIADVSPYLSDIYMANHQPDSAYKYLKLSVNLKDSSFTLAKIRQFQNLTFNESIRKQQQEQQAEILNQQYQSKIKVYGLAAGVAVLLAFALILFRNNGRERKANRLLARQKLEVQNTLGELKSAQAQLIQSEKMASLGELTAGIAHEIQNPLNFVNNFSELNKELLVEINENIDKGNLHDIKMLAKDVIENEEKIGFHGKRASSIVKGMLQHSKTADGQKELTNINALAEEYLSLSYQGLRAKDKSFNATLQTIFDPTIVEMQIVPQDMGRVLLNLYNNAFYAVLDKKKLAGNGFIPTVSVSTRNEGSRVEIRVKDNGDGIPSALRDKIWQPFFTTKPTGQGTGLGLSLSYDIVKAHGGELKIESTEGEGAEFLLILPLE
jgi:two-component system, NtrC family, sensor kinase